MKQQRNKTLFLSVSETTVFSLCNIAYGFHSDGHIIFIFSLPFFLAPKHKLFPATLQNFFPLMIWSEITTYSADRGKTTRISNTSETEWYTAAGSKLNEVSYPKALVSLSALLSLSLRPQIWVSRSAVTILKVCRPKKSPVN